ncbi:MAG: M20/M25/M40 family metallo-hydrolase [Ignavibacteriales bacterium]|nr:M20/M25/M40 family metallo-hydrolase [Ignavibacteriales bacterium]
MAKFLITFLEKLGLKPAEDESANISDGNTGNIICKIGTGGNYVLLSHMDTARSTLNLKPKILADRITSDGTTILGADNRAGIASLIYSLEKLVKGNILLKDFTLAFTTQEETTLHGSQNLDLNGNIKMGFVFDSHLKPGNFICESAGSVGFCIKVKGKASHSGLAPENGIDSIKIASVAISKINLGKIDSDTTANIGIINGGTATNVVPELTSIHGEIRSTVPSKIDVKLSEIKHEFISTAKLYGGECEFESFWNFKPYKITPDNETYKTIERAIRNVGIIPIPEISKGGSDANSLNTKGIPTVNLGIGAENPHANDEYILFEDLQKTAEIAMELMKK